MGSSVRLIPPLREIRLHLCQTSASSRGVRDFIERHYVSIKKINMQFPILIRECSGVIPSVWARYDHGREKNLSLENLDGDAVFSIIKNLATDK